MHIFGSTCLLGLLGQITIAVSLPNLDRRENSASSLAFDGTGQASTGSSTLVAPLGKKNVGTTSLPSNEIELLWTDELYAIVSLLSTGEPQDFESISGLLRSACQDVRNRPAEEAVVGTYSFPGLNMEEFWIRNFKDLDPRRKLRYGEIADLLATVLLPWLSKRHASRIPIYHFKLDVFAYGRVLPQTIALGGATMRPETALNITDNSVEITRRNIS